MCVIAVKQEGVALPTLETITTMWTRNPDGAGYMYAKDGKVYVRKGLMTLSDFNESLHSVPDIESLPVIMHFRIGTHGGLRAPECTHPFPVTDDEKSLQKLNYKTNIAFAHNGVISGIRRDKKLSDTMVYSQDILSALRKSNLKFYKDPALLQVIENTIEGSRMVFMDGQGYITMVGNWVEDKETGLIYSNSTYKPYNPSDYGRKSYYSGDGLLLDDDLYLASSKGIPVNHTMSKDVIEDKRGDLYVKIPNDAIVCTEYDDWLLLSDFGTGDWYADEDGDCYELIGGELYPSEICGAYDDEGNQISSFDLINTKINVGEMNNEI